MGKLNRDFATVAALLSVRGGVARLIRDFSSPFVCRATAKAPTAGKGSMRLRIGLLLSETTCHISGADSLGFTSLRTG